MNLAEMTAGHRLRSSHLLAANKSAKHFAHAWQQWLQEPDTDDEQNDGGGTVAMVRGSLVDRLLIFGDCRAEEGGTVRVTDVNRNTNEFKAMRALPGLIVKEAEYASALREVEEILANPELLAIFRHPERIAGVTRTFHHPSGARFRFTVDCETPDIVVDLKRTDVDLAKLQWTIRDRGYHVQGALYTMATGLPLPFANVFVEGEEPHCVVIVDHDAATGAAGEQAIDHALATIESNLRKHGPPSTNTWPGPPRATVHIEPDREVFV